MNTASIFRHHPHRWPHRHSQVWLERIDRIYRDCLGEPTPSLEEAHRIVFNTDIRTSRRERVLIALLAHPDRCAAGAILEDQCLPADSDRLRFVLHILRKRHRRRHKRLEQAA